MTEENLPALAQAAAFDASVYDQLGCLSPHVYCNVEERGQLGSAEICRGTGGGDVAMYQARILRAVNFRWKKRRKWPNSGRVMNSAQQATSDSSFGAVLRGMTGQ